MNVDRAFMQISHAEAHKVASRDVKKVLGTIGIISAEHATRS